MLWTQCKDRIVDGMLGAIAFGNILGMILNVMILTSAMKSAYDSLLVVKEKIQEKLLVTFDKEDRQHLKFLLAKVKSLGPVNACGYFEITNSTLTSMLGIR